MEPYQEVLSDLLQIYPEETVEYPAPYDDNMTFERKFIVTQKSLERARRLKNRILQLVNAFYLGKLLEHEANSSTQRSYYA